MIASIHHEEKGKMIASIHHEETCIFQTQSHNKGVGSIIGAVRPSACEVNE